MLYPAVDMVAVTLRANSGSLQYWKDRAEAAEARAESLQSKVAELEEAIRRGRTEYEESQAWVRKWASDCGRLEKELAEVKRDCAGMCQVVRDRDAELAEVRKDAEWKLVTEELPKSGVPVLAFFKNTYGHGRRIRAYYYPKFTKEDDGDYTGDSEYDEVTDGCYWPEGWYEANECEEINWHVSENVTHWMPLPAGPIDAALSEGEPE